MRVDISSNGDACHPGSFLLLIRSSSNVSAGLIPIQGINTILPIVLASITAW